MSNVRTFFSSILSPQVKTSNRHVESGLLLMMESATVTLPKGPNITVYKGWTPARKRGNVIKSVPAVDPPCFEPHTFSISSQRGKSLAAKSSVEETPVIGQIIPAVKPRRTGQLIDFVNNAFEPLHTKDAAVRRLVRSHAMKEVARERREQRKTRLKDVDIKREKARGTNEPSLPSERPTERPSGDHVISLPPEQGYSVPYALLRPEIDYCFMDYLSQIQAKTRRLASLYFPQIGSAIFPMEFHLAYNPPMQLWTLDSTFTDDVVIQSMSYTAAVCTTLAEGKRYSSDIAAQMSLTIGMINRLLEGGMGLADGMLGAVTHLAMGEVSGANFLRNKTRPLILEPENRCYVGTSAIGQSI